MPSLVAIFISYENCGLWVLFYFVRFLVQKNGINSEKCIELWQVATFRLIKPQCGRPKRAELPGVNINTGTQSINSERALKLLLEAQTSDNSLLV